LDSESATDCVLLIEDTTERKLADERLRHALEEQQLMFENVAVGIMFTQDRIVQRCNRRCCEIFGASFDEMMHHTTEHLFHDTETYQGFGEDMNRAIRREGQYCAEFEIFRKDGSRLWIQVSGQRIVVEDASLHVIWIVEDVNERHHALKALEEHGQLLENKVAERTNELAEANLRLREEIIERRRAEDRLWHVANHDALTGLPNRTLFADRLKHSLAQATRRQAKIALVCVDIDRFKTINDSLGHALGDRLLQEAASRLKRIVRTEDTVARLGGDEFIFIIEDIKTTAGIVELTERLRCSLLPPVVVEGHAMHVTASFGVSIFPDDGRDGQVLMRHADTAMHHAKASGRNMVKIFNPEMNIAVRHFYEIEAKLRDALGAGEFELHYQPIVDAQNSSVVGMEALIRWNRAGKCISPIEFIPVAEESGLILPIGNWVLRQACQQAIQWSEAGFGPFIMAVNLSARQFREPNLARLVEDILLETGLPPEYLELEITESTLMDQVDNTLTTLNLLSDMGIRLAVDDFGTGYSSLNYLKRFPVHKLKIDQSFVREICTDRDDAAIVGAIIDLSRNLGLVSQAEGVENQDQLDALLAAGCTHFQGYHFAKPLRPHDIERFLADWTLS
jgi:diguanylate cyclase (GGDEF)-like protein/PAS domain S-box-containing protein